MRMAKKWNKYKQMKLLKIIVDKNYKQGNAVIPWSSVLKLPNTEYRHVLAKPLVKTILLNLSAWCIIN